MLNRNSETLMRDFWERQGCNGWGLGRQKGGQWGCWGSVLKPGAIRL